MSENEEVKKRTRTKKSEKTELKIAWRKLTETAKIPAKAHIDDAGYDLYSDEDVIIKPHKTVTIKTGIAAQMTPPEGWNAFLEVKDTSGNAAKLKLSTKAGVVDIGYNGNIGVVIRNNNFFKKIKIKKGAKIAQGIPFLIPFCKEAEWVEKDTERGAKGYGESSGTAVSK